LNSPEALAGASIAGMKPVHNPLVIALAFILAACLLACLGAVVIQPTLISGRFYEIDITSVEIATWGGMEIRYNDRFAYDSEIVWLRPPIAVHQGADGWDNCKPTFLRWPRKRENEVIRAYIRTTEEESAGVQDLEMYRQRMLVKKGAYRIRSGESLPLYRYKGTDGSLIEGKIVLRPKS
jgi:hypothetical protein